MSKTPESSAISPDNRSQDGLKPSELLKGTSVFISYGREDREKVETIYQTLKKLGCNPWMDVHSLPAGSNWAYEIEIAEESCEFALVCLSNTTVNRDGYINKETKQLLDLYEKKLEGKIFLIPIRLEECQIPHRLSYLEYVDIFSEGGYQKMISGMIVQKKRSSRRA